MKIKAHFIPTRPSAWPLAIGLWAAALGYAVAAVMLSSNRARLQAETAALQARLTQLNVQAAALTPPVALPAPPELQALSRRVAAINALTASRGLATPEVLAWFEAHLPEDVRLLSLDHKARDGEILFVAEARNGESITRLLRDLEDDKRLSDVLLSRQGTQPGTTPNNQPGGQDSPGVRFEVRIRQKPCNPQCGSNASPTACSIRWPPVACWHACWRRRRP